MKLTDVLALRLKQNCIERVHGVTGGGAVHIFDSVKAAGIAPIFYQHEQAASFAAVGESKKTKQLACCVVTTGPGGTNAITGLASAWTDSIPVLFISGQARLEHMSSRNRVRQLGTQEIDIVSIVKSITKLSLTLENANELDLVIDRLISTAYEGRPGPVWLDIPLDFQWAEINLPPGHGVSISPGPGKSGSAEETIAAQKIMDGAPFRDFLSDFRRSKRPVFLIGGGVPLHAKQKLTSWLRTRAYPYTLTYNSLELSDCRTDPMNFGIVGIAGRRAANALIHNCDHLVSIGTHLPLPLTGALTAKWCAQAKKTLVNIDQHELNVTRLAIDHKFCLDSARFVERLCSLDSGSCPQVSAEWTEFCDALRRLKEPGYSPPAPYVDQYHFLNLLSDCLRPFDVISVDGGGTINASAFTTLRPYPTTSIIMSSGMCSMGSGIPEAIGACLGNRSAEARFILLIGDGSLQFNVQELATVYSTGIPLKIFVISNAGYSSIRITQKQFLGNRQLGVSADSGVYLPDLSMIARTYNFSYRKLENSPCLSDEIGRILDLDEPVLIEVMVHPEQPIGPSQGFRQKDDGTFAASPLHSMNPPLGEDEERLFTKWAN